MKNHVQPGHYLTFTAAAPVTHGQGVLMGALFGIAATNAATGEDFEAAITGVYELPKAAEEITAGARVYWDAAEGHVTLDDDGNPLVGAATVTAAAGAALVPVRLNGVTV